MAALFILAGISVLVIFGMLGSGESEPVERYVRAVGIGLFALALVVEALGLAANRPWAVAARTPMLGLLLISAGASFVHDLGAGHTTIPLAPFLVVWALRGHETESSVSRGVSRASTAGAAAVVAFAALALIWDQPAAVLLRPGGLLVSAPSDLVQSLVLDCDGRNEAGPTATVGYGWSWTRAEPFMGASDRIVIAWTEVVNGEPEMPALLNVQWAADGLYASNVDFNPAGEIAAYGVDLREQQFAPGQLTLVLQRQSEVPAGARHLEVRAFYTRAPTNFNGYDRNGWWSTPDTTASCDQ